MYNNSWLCHYVHTAPLYGADVFERLDENRWLAINTSYAGPRAGSWQLADRVLRGWNVSRKKIRNTKLIIKKIFSHVRILTITSCARLAASALSVMWGKFIKIKMFWKFTDCQKKQTCQRLKLKSNWALTDAEMLSEDENDKKKTIFDKILFTLMEIPFVLGL